MRFCQYCGKEVMDEAVLCVHCGCSLGKHYNLVDEVSVGLCVLSAFFPIFGFVYWPVNHSKTPKRAAACGITAIVAFVVLQIIIAITTPNYY